MAENRLSLLAGRNDTGDRQDILRHQNYYIISLEICKTQSREFVTILLGVVIICYFFVNLHVYSYRSISKKGFIDLTEHSW
jgi:hypothetical protein